MPLAIAYLEMPITHLCSLHCDGCSAYSNYNIKRTVPLAEARAWLREWSKRVTPGYFRILGGEPFLHPNFAEIFLSVRQFWPEAHIQVCTNGMNIDRQPMAPFLFAQPNTSLNLSVHSRDEGYLDKFNAALATVNSWIADFGIRAHLGDNISKWNRFYKGIGKYMEPFEDGDFHTSWHVCHSQHCCNLIDNRLWKCPQIGNLHIVSDKFGLHKNPRWHEYLEYKGIGLEATDAELERWLRDRAGPEEVCGMCPAHLDNYEKDIFNVDFDLPDRDRLERPTIGANA